MPKGPDVPPRLLILIAVAAVLGLFLVVNPFGGGEEPVAPPPPVAEEEPVGSQTPPAETATTPASGDAEGQITAALDRAFVTFDGAACTEVMTTRLLRQTSFQNGDPLADCEEDAEEDDNADSIDVREIEVKGAKATARVAPVGGPQAGAAFTIELVDDAGWKLDRIADVEITDPERFVDSQVSGLVDTGFTAADGKCVGRWISDEVPVETLERTYVTGDNSWAFDAIRACIGDGTDAGVLAEVLRRSLIEEQGLSDSQADCAVRSLRGELERFPLERADELESDPKFAVAAQAAGAKCVGAAGPQGEPPAAPAGGGGGGGGSDDPQEQYLDCVAAADDRDAIRACEQKVYGG